LPQVGSQGGVEVFRTIEIGNRFGNMAELKVGHAPLDVALGMMRVRPEVARQEL
jgi:hypothetical protein